jgi:hypothetical protein
MAAQRFIAGYPAISATQFGRTVENSSEHIVRVKISFALLQQLKELVFECVLSVVLLLAVNVMHDSILLRRAHAQGRESFLPRKPMLEIFVTPLR